jgi:hypothetical protein
MCHAKPQRAQRKTVKSIKKKIGGFAALREGETWRLCALA